MCFVPYFILCTVFLERSTDPTAQTMVSTAVYIVDFMGRSLTLLDSTTPGSWEFSTEEKRPFSLRIVNGVNTLSIQLVDGPFLSFSTSNGTIGTAESASNSSSTLEAYADVEKREFLFIQFF